jgi:hypothetical protein
MVIFSYRGDELQFLAFGLESSASSLDSIESPLCQIDDPHSAYGCLLPRDQRLWTTEPGSVWRDGNPERNRALRAEDHDVLLCEGNKDVLSVLEAFMRAGARGWPTGMAFNMAYGIQGRCRYTHVPAILDMARVPYTGSGLLDTRWPSIT